MATGSVSAIDQENWQLISTTSFTSTNNYALSTGLGGVYKSLMVVWRSTSKDNQAKAMIQFNSDTTDGNYGSTAWWTETTNFNWVRNGMIIASSADFGSTTESGYAIFDNCNQSVIPVITRDAGGQSGSGAKGLWLGYAPVTSINFRTTNASYNFHEGTVKLFGLAG